MKGIDDFLKKFELIRNPSDDKQIIKDSLKKVCNLDIDVKNVKIQGNTIFLNIQPIEKNVVFMKKSLIIKDVVEKLSKKGISEIR